jgi:hypothetical protein
MNMKSAIRRKGWPIKFVSITIGAVDHDSTFAAASGTLVHVGPAT